MDIKGEYQELIEDIKKSSRPIGSHDTAGYLGTPHHLYNVSIPDLRKLASGWVNKHKNIGTKDLLLFIDMLYFGKSREEKVIASFILGRYPQFIKNISFKKIDSWTQELRGWEETDVFCWNMLYIWFEEDIGNNIGALQKWNRDNQIEKRRASLVVLCKVFMRKPALSLIPIAFGFINNVKHEKDVLITKAVSWLLRSMTRHYKIQVKAYLFKNKNTLPQIAVRESMNKILTGKK